MTLQGGQLAPLFAYLLLTMGMPSPRRAARLAPVHWEPDASGRWARASGTVGPVQDRAIDPSRPAIIARCLDQIARATERMSGLAHEINRRHTRG